MTWKLGKDPFSDRHQDNLKITNDHLMNKTDLLSHISIILVRPKYAGNIGAAARIAWNMGINSLQVVGSELPERETIARLATHNAAHIVENITCYSTLKEALSPFSVIIGTTARRGRQRLTEKSPREIAESVLPALAENRVAIVFGPEDCGLTNEELKYCQLLSAIPTADFSSLNLAQAVAIHCYEFYYGIIHMQRDVSPAPRLASSFELESMYSCLQESLTHIHFLGDKNHLYWMNNIRHFFGRIKLTSKDTNIIRKVCRQFSAHLKTERNRDDEHNTIRGKQS